MFEQRAQLFGKFRSVSGAAGDLGIALRRGHF
jgi:hypothetical protein